jgi:WhiB family redox-sensing transcriptional regulator
MTDNDTQTLDTHWSQLGICRGKLDLFFPKVAERPQRRAKREAQAVAICRQCPVSAECREYGRNNHEYGVWGGETETERHASGFYLSAMIGLRNRTKVSTSQQ